MGSVAQFTGSICREGDGRGVGVGGELRDGEGVGGMRVPHPHGQPGWRQSSLTHGISPGWGGGSGEGGPSSPRAAPGVGRGRGAQGPELGWGCGVRVPHPQGCPDGGQLEEDPPPLLGTDISQLGRAHLQQLVARQHPQSPHRAAGGDRGEPGTHAGFGGQGLSRPPTSARSPCPSARPSPPPARSWGAGWGGCPGAGDKGTSG